MDFEKLLKELRAKLAALQVRSAAIMASATTRTEAALTPEEDAELDQIEKDMEATRAGITKNEARKKTLGAEAIAQANGSDATGADTRAAAPVMTVVEVVQKDEPVFRNIAEQLAAIVHADVRNPHATSEQRTVARNRLSLMMKKADKEARAYAALSGTEYRAPAGLSTLVDSDGGYLVQPDIAAGILQGAFEESSLASDCSMTEISQNAQGLVQYMIDENSRANGSRYGGVRAYWGNEGDTAASSRPKMKRWFCQLDKLMSFGYATSEELDDAAAMASIMTENFEKEIAFQIDDAVYEGTGSQMPLGIMNSTYKGTVVVAKETSPAQAAATIVAMNFIRMRNRLLASAKGAKWYINKELREQLPTMFLSTGTNSGQLIYMPAGGITGAQYDTVLGMPIVTTEFNNAPGTPGDVLLGDLSFYKLIKKGGPQMDQSIHVNFSTDETVFRVKQRIGGKPQFDQPLAPFKGSQTHSPFVLLAQR